MKNGILEAGKALEKAAKDAGESMNKLGETLKELHKPEYDKNGKYIPQAGNIYSTTWKKIPKVVKNRKRSKAARKSRQINRRT